MPPAANLEAVDPPDELVRTLRADLDQRLAALRRAARRVRRRDDDDAIHDLRVVIRRLTAALRVLRPLLRRRARRRALRSLRALRARLGPVREAEVHLAELRRRFAAAHNAELFAAADVVGRLEREVTSGRRRAARACDESRVARVLDRVHAAASRLAERLAEHPEWVPGVPAHVAALEQQATLTLDQAVAAPDDAHLHDARVAIKKWRYGIEWGAALGLAPPPAILRETQRTLGEIHDRATLRDRIAEEMERRGPSSDSIRRLALAGLTAEIERERRARVATFLATQKGPNAPPPASPVEFRAP